MKTSWADTSGLAKRYLHFRLAVAGSKMARDQQKECQGGVSDSAFNDVA